MRRCMMKLCGKGGGKVQCRLNAYMVWNRILNIDIYVSGEPILF